MDKPLDRLLKIQGELNSADLYITNLRQERNLILKDLRSGGATLGQLAALTGMTRQGVQFVTKTGGVDAQSKK